MDLDEVTDELYGLRPQEFTAARDDRARRARADGQRELAAQIRELRRPTIAAWASNLLVREQGDQVAPLLRLGEELRGAHRDLNGDELRALSREQHRLVDALAREAARLASSSGQKLGPQAQQEVAQTLHAVLTDPDAAQEWAAGRLSRPLAATPGFDAAAREAAAATTDGRGKPKRGREPARRTARPEQPSRKARTGGPAQKGSSAKASQKAADSRREAWAAAREAADESRRLHREAEKAAEETAAARADREEAEERVERLREEMREAEEARKESRSREREAERSGREARRRAEKAQEAADRARRTAGR